MKKLEIKNSIDGLNKFLFGKKVLITGHTGFKGSWLTLLLLMHGAKVYGYSLPLDIKQTFFKDLFNSENSSKELTGELFHNEGDINNFENLSKFVKGVNPQLVFHLAAQPLVQKSYEYPIKTWETNVMGSINLLESLRLLENPCAAVFITTDKVYENKEWLYGYRENDTLGGKDPYSSSKAAMELAIKSWRHSFCGLKSHQTSKISISTARAGNVIGGGDLSENRIMPDIVRALSDQKSIELRNPNAKRPWQHVLEPLFGYLMLIKKSYDYQVKNNSNVNNPYANAFNFGPNICSNKSVKDLVEEVLSIWPGDWVDKSNKNEPQEAELLHLVSDKAYELLGWKPKINFQETIKLTTNWYKDKTDGLSPLEITINNIKYYQNKENY